MNVHLSHLERVRQPGLGEVTAACRGQRAAHRVVPPLAVGAVEAMSEAEDRERWPGVRPQFGSACGIVGRVMTTQRNEREARVPFHDRLAPGQLLLRGPHGGRIDVGQDAKFREKACFAEFQQLWASSHPRKRT